jgi:hypothetical protein
LRSGAVGAELARRVRVGLHLHDLLLSRIFERHTCAQPMYRRCSPVRPSMTGAFLPFSEIL